MYSIRPNSDRMSNTSVRVSHLNNSILAELEFSVDIMSNKAFFPSDSWTLDGVTHSLFELQSRKEGIIYSPIVMA